VSGSVAGACLCGAVTFTVALPPKWVAHCHCSMCRRAHGAGFVTWVGVEAGAFTLTKSEALATYASSPGASRQFCAKCGSPLFFKSERWPGEVHVARAAIAGDVGMNPAAHAFFSDKADWVHVNDQLPKRGGKTGTEPLPST
jgi:hypothetical protein